MRLSSLPTLSGWFDVEPGGIPFFAASYNIAPQSVQPVVRLNAMSGNREFALQRWGLVPFWAKDAKLGFSTFNARAEEAARKPASARH
jgi:putative SOS response-associated peptidase YedK